MIQKYFRRYEIKYQISTTERDVIKAYLNGFMEPDPFVQNGRDYEVRSLYFDSPSRKAYHEKLNGEAFRRKLRIRYYPGSQNSTPKTVFLEIKRKNGENVSKARIQVPFDNALELAEGTSHFAEQFHATLSHQDQTILQEVWYLVRLHHLKPAIVVSYKRQAFRGQEEKRFRLTFDSEIRVRKTNFDLHYGYGVKYILPRDVVVMEAKFNEHIPAWAIRILQSNNCWQEKISKFAQGIEKTRIGSSPGKFFPNYQISKNSSTIISTDNQITLFQQPIGKEPLIQKRS